MPMQPTRLMTDQELGVGINAYFDVNNAERAIDRCFFLARQECPVCFEHFTTEEFQQSQIVATRCMHLFHMHCLETWTDKEASCPSCRRMVVMGTDCARWKVLCQAIAFHFAERVENLNLSDEAIARRLHYAYGGEPLPEEAIPVREAPATTPTPSFFYSLLRKIVPWQL